MVVSIQSSRHHPIIDGLRDYQTATWEGGDPKCKHSVGNQVSDKKAPAAITNGVRPGVDASTCKKCGAIRTKDRQIGLEKTVDEYVAKLVTLFREARRVLRDDGVLFLNLGDSYASSWASGRRSVIGQGSRTNRHNRLDGNNGIKEKDLMGIPFRVALALQADGWIWRSTAPWLKSSCLPESVQDRVSTSHEYVFMFVKSQRYWFDQDAVRVPSKTESQQRAMRAVSPHHKNLHIPGQTQHSLHKARAHGEGYDLPEARNRRSGDTFLEMIDAQIEELLYMREVVNRKGVMVDGDTISAFYLGPEPNPAAHFATFPQKLVEPLVLCGCPHQVCSACKAPYVRVTERITNFHNVKEGQKQALRNNGAQTGGTEMVTLGVTNKIIRTTKGFVPTCECHADSEPGVTLDPFSGSGTVALVARRLGRNYAGIELNPEYIKISDYALRLPFERVEQPQGDHSVSDLPLFQSLNGS